MSVSARQAAQEAESRALLEHIETLCTATGDTFVDDSFRPTDQSVYIDGRTWSRVDVQERRGAMESRVTQWLRPGEMRRGNTNFDLFNQPWCVFRGQPQPDDAKQGSLGDCWLLSAISVLADRPELLRKLFPGGGEISRSGAYPVRLCLDGEWRVIVVDDMMPCTRYGTLAFSQAARRQLYVPLLEKAFAKAYGSYEAIEAGTCDEALAALTGAPCEQVRLQAPPGSPEALDEGMLWAKLLSFREAGFLAGASCGTDNQASVALGLQTSHAYSVLDVRSVPGGHRLLRLRNPWGRGEWTGAWSTRAAQWTPELRRLLRPEDGAGGGTFWIAWEDFLSHFRAVDVCKVRESAVWMEVRERTELPTTAMPGNHWASFDLELFETTTLDLVLFQRNARGAAEDGSVQQVDLSFAIFAQGSGGSLGQLMGTSHRRVHPSVCCEMTLSAGHYFVIPLGFNQLGGPGEPRPVVLAAFSAKPVVLTKRAPTPAALVRDVVASVVKTKGERNVLFAGDMCVYNLSDEAGSIVYAENRSWVQRLTVSIDARDSFNLVSSRGQLTLEDSLLPGQGQLLLALTHLEPSEGYTSAFQFQFRADLGREHHHPSVPSTGGLHSTARAQS